MPSGARVFGWPAMRAAGGSGARLALPMALRTTFRLGLTALSFWPFLPFLQRAPIYGRLLIELALDGRVPWSRKAILGMAGAYIVAPIDVIPDWIPIISRFDDVMVTIIALDLFLEGVPRDLMIEKMYALGIDGRELERDMEAARRLLPMPVRSLARRLPALMETSASVLRVELAERGIIEQ
jgi:uncharacterized membrane protein YkvA (DUF1232 family)